MPIFPKGMITKQRLLLASSWDKEKEALSDEETVREDTLVCVDFKAGMGLSLPSCGFLISGWFCEMPVKGFVAFVCAYII